MSKTRWLWVVIAVCLVLGTLLPVTAASTLPLVAVLPFDDGSIKHWWWDDWHVGKGIADMIVVELLAQKKFRLVEREKIEAVVNEQNFGASGRVDNASAAKIGKILGVKYIVIGRVTEFTVDDKNIGVGGVGLKASTARVALDGRIVDTTTAEIIAAVAGKGESRQTGVNLSLSNFPHVQFGADRFEETILGKASRSAINQFCAKLTEEFAKVDPAATAAAGPISGSVAAVVGNKVYLDIGTSDGVAKGMVFVIERVVQEVKNKAGEVIDVVTEPICEITIGEVKDRSSNGTITSTLSKTLKPQEGDLANKK